MPSTRLVRRRAVQIAVTAVVLAVSGCSAGEPRSIGPAGVDGLDIPTRSPDPVDFVDTIDNPWLPLVPGSRWVYESSDGETITVSVPGGTELIAGVEATLVETLVERGRRSESSKRWLAQDRAGNVWSFGAESDAVDWTAGVAGAQAGLVMPARPRLGDGFRRQLVPGVADGRSEVVDLSASASVPYGEWSDLLAIRETDGLDPAVRAVAYYAVGTGLVLTETAQTQTQLVSFTQP
ncbi:hypothetical protein [Nocardioides piscis]|uniref:Uncharacterized protein n=1 Tax=Nocardioides piscis TaxID=2714938 RepID=A0A6G7YFE4_9ACTN|nr:hypothetical protein [Nocardioides piscis]QIK75513.1 hypothetical protein G7071_08725 [Nocardioides piscis]